MEELQRTRQLCIKRLYLKYKGTRLWQFYKFKLLLLNIQKIKILIISTTAKIEFRQWHGNIFLHYSNSVHAVHICIYIYITNINLFKNFTNIHERFYYYQFLRLELQNIFINHK